MTEIRQIKYSYVPVPTIQEFADDDSFIKGLEGPFGSGKSSGCVIDILNRSMHQRRSPDGIRHSRWAVVRNTFPELRDTTIKTVFQWLPPHYFGTYLESKHTYTVRAFEGVQLEMLFLALDRPQDISKLLSLELTGGWINEGREVPWSIFEAMTGRVGRWPPQRDGGPSWSGIISDTNPPDTDSRWYRFFNEEKHKPGHVAIYRQPSGLAKDAENLVNLPGGRLYYERLAAGKSQEWINVYVHGRYGFVSEGKLVYPEYADTIHCKAVDPVPGVTVTVGLDFGLTPAAALCQMLPDGRFLVFDELTSDNMSVDQFGDELLDHLARSFRGQATFDFIGDPAGNIRAETDKRSAFDILRGKGIDVEPAYSQEPSLRQEAIRRPLRTLSSGEPQFVIHPRCRQLRKGFLGGYHRRRMQTGGPERYSEKPEKNQYSHCVLEGAVVSTPQGLVPIEDLRVGDVVSTPLGPRRVMATMNREAPERVDLRTSSGSVLACTPDHPVWANGSFVRADALQYADVLWGAPEWAVQPSTSRRTSTGGGTTSSPRATTKRTTGATCTAMSGSTTTARSPMGTTSITSTMIEGITRSRIWIACTALITSRCIRPNERRLTPKPRERTWPLSAPRPASGTGPKKDAHGIASTAWRWRQDWRSALSSAFAAAPVISLSGANGSAAIALPLANRLRAEHAATTTNSGRVSSAATRSRSIGTPRRGHADLVAGVSLPRRGAWRVYDLTVDEAHCFFANGVLVSNCHDALQYAAIEHFGPMLTQPVGEYDDWPEPHELGPSGRSDFTGY